MSAPVRSPLRQAVAAAVTSVLLAGHGASQSPVTATATVQRLTATTQLAGAAPVVQSVPAGTQLGLGVQVSTYGNPTARNYAAIFAGPSAIEVDVRQLAFAFGAGNAAAFDTDLAVSYTSTAPTTFDLELVTTVALPGFGGAGETP